MAHDALLAGVGRVQFIFELGDPIAELPSAESGLTPHVLGLITKRLSAR